MAKRVSDGCVGEEVGTRSRKTATEAITPMTAEARLHNIGPRQPLRVRLSTPAGCSADRGAVNASSISIRASAIS